MSESGTIKKLKNGEVIFKEGEPSGSAYVIVKGSVELTKDSKYGAVLLAKLKQGELFGEMGVIDGSPRSATSRAVGATTIKEIPPSTLMKGIQSDPDLSSKVMGKLVERLRAADDMLAKAGVSPADGSAAKPPARQGATGNAQPKKKGFLSRLFNANKGRESTYEILVADFFDDENEKATAHYYECLKQTVERLGGGIVNVRRTNSAFALADFSDSPMVWGQVKTNAQRWLHELEGDLLIWGQVRARGQVIHLRMAQSQPLRQNRAGLIMPCDGVDIPAELDDVLAGYAYAMAVGAFVPANKTQRDSYEALLGPALDAARPALQKRIREFDPDEQIRFEVGFANLLATCGITKKRGDRLKEAEETYIKALRSLRRSKSDLLEGIIKRHLGYTQSSWHDLGGEKNLIEASIESFREASDFFNKANFPQEWADLQAMTGQLLFKKDQQEDSDTALRESIAAYQSALQVFSASSTPRRWGEAKHHLARALQLLGSQSGDLDMIARSAEACREALVVRSKTQTPMLWAATQNNLGSALFMLSQKTKKPETADAAVKAFEAALEIYEATKAQKLAKVTQKNLSRAKEVAIDLGPIADTSPVEEEDGFAEDDFDDVDNGVDELPEEETAPTP